MAAQATAILERTNVHARKEDIDETYFKPLHRLEVEWRDAYHVV